MNWAWLDRNTEQILSWLVAHFWLALIPTVLGLLLASPSAPPPTGTDGATAC
jgi:hypothetical protein